MTEARTFMRSIIGVGIGARLWRDPGSGCRPSNVYVPTASLSSIRIPVDEGDELVTRWRAVAGVGPMAPLLLLAITHKERIEISLSWRDTLFSHEEVQSLVSRINH